MLMQQADENNNTVQIYSQSQGNDSKEGSPGIAEHGAMDPYENSGAQELAPGGATGAFALPDLK